MADGTLESSGSTGSMPTGTGSERLRRLSLEGLNDLYLNMWLYIYIYIYVLIYMYIYIYI